VGTDPQSSICELAGNYVYGCPTPKQSKNSEEDVRRGLYLYVGLSHSSLH